MTTVSGAFKRRFSVYTRTQKVLGVVRLVLFWAGYILLALVDFRIAFGVLCLHAQKSILEWEIEWYKSD